MGLTTEKSKDISDKPNIINFMALSCAIRANAIMEISLKNSLILSDAYKQCYIEDGTSIHVMHPISNKLIALVCEDTNIYLAELSSKIYSETSTSDFLNFVRYPAKKTTLFTSFPALSGHTLLVRGIITISDQYIASFSHDKTVRVWDISKRQCVAVLIHTAQIRAISFLSNTQIVSIDDKNIMKIWDFTNNQINEIKVAKENDTSMNVFSLCRLSNQNLVMGHSNGLITIFNHHIGKHIHSFDSFHNGPVRSVQYVDYDLLVSCGGKTIKIWNLNDLTCLSTFEVTTHIYRTDVMPNGNVIASCNNGIQIWDMFKGKMVQMIDVHSHTATNFCQYGATVLIPDSRLRILEFQTRKVKLEDLKTLVNLLKYNTSVINLDLQGLDFGDSGAMIVAKLLRTNRSLKRIDLSNNNITNYGARALLEALNVNGIVSSLLLSNNAIDNSLQDAIQLYISNAKNVLTQQSEPTGHATEKPITYIGGNTMKKLWVTYAWRDNEDQDIDYILQQIETEGGEELSVRYDRRELIPGQRLWEQIAENISDPQKCDAWSIVLTENSINSDACKEEIAYALQQALNRRGQNFPIIGLLHNMNLHQLPHKLQPIFSTRLCISLNTRNWKSLVIAAAKGIRPGHELPTDLQDYVVKNHTRENYEYVEIRPRTGSQSPFYIAVDHNEIQSNDVTILYGEKGIIPNESIALLNASSQERSLDNTRKIVYKTDNPATSQYSYYFRCKTLPQQIWFGDSVTALSKHVFHYSSSTSEHESSSVAAPQTLSHQNDSHQTSSLTQDQGCSRPLGSGIFAGKSITVGKSIICDGQIRAGDDLTVGKNVKAIESVSAGKNVSIGEELVVTNEHEKKANFR